MEETDYGDVFQQAVDHDVGLVPWYQLAIDTLRNIQATYNMKSPFSATSSYFFAISLTQYLNIYNNLLPKINPTHTNMQETS